MSAPFAYSILKVNEQNLSVQVENVYDKSTWERQVNMFHWLLPKRILVGLDTICWGSVHKCFACPVFRMGLKSLKLSSCKNARISTMCIHAPWLKCEWYQSTVGRRLIHNQVATALYTCAVSCLPHPDKCHMQLEPNQENPCPYGSWASGSVDQPAHPFKFEWNLSPFM